MHNTVKCKLCGQIFAQGGSYPNALIICGKCKPYAEREPKMMIISIDYDMTFTLGFDFWRDFCQNAVAKGHTVIMTTGRQQQDIEEIRQNIGIDIPIICAGTKWKRDAAKAAGYDVDIWIDDAPEYISNVLQIANTELSSPE